MGKVLKDRFNRIISYLRVSVTDRCNLRCVYCMPERGVKFYPHSEILRYEEVEEIIDVAVELGMKKVRFTGGEPLVRRGFVDFVSRVHQTHPGLELALTTNGILLGDYIEDLKSAGITRLNISLDSLEADKYHYITRVGSLNAVLNSIQMAVKAGYSSLRVNVVCMKGINDDEIYDFVKFSMQNGVIVRFIEFMPLGGDVWSKDRFISASEIKRMVEKKFKLEPILDKKETDGPASYYRVENEGVVGFIAAITEHFCDRCNRIRLTSTGVLRPCLFSDKGVDLRAIIRSGGSKDALRQGIIDAVNMKPAGWWETVGTNILMSKIGG